MREIRLYGSEGGAAQLNAPSLPLFPIGASSSEWNAQILANLAGEIVIDLGVARDGRATVLGRISPP